MLAALVIIGAAACTENYDGIEKTNEAEVFSFYAEVVNDGTRAYIADTDGDKTWNTVWEEGDVLIVKHNGEHGAGEYTFVCKDATTGRFSCSDNNVANIAGESVTITTKGDHKSSQGKKAFYTTANVDAFGNGDKIEFTALTSFFRYTFNGEGEVKLTMNTDAFIDDEGKRTNEIAVSGYGEHFVAFWPVATNSSLALTVNGEEAKNADALALTAGKIYNLGTYEGTKHEMFGIVGDHQGWNSASPEAMYLIPNSNTYVRRNVKLGAGGFKFYGTSTTTEIKHHPEVTGGESGDYYLVPNNNWKIDNARFAIYFFGNGETWVSMADTNGDGIYVGNKPSNGKSYPSMIFCRMNPNATANNWNNKWNQTSDLTCPTNGNNCYTVREGSWDKGGGTWSVHTPQEHQDAYDEVIEVTTEYWLGLDNGVNFTTAWAMGYSNNGAQDIKVSDVNKTYDIYFSIGETFDWGFQSLCIVLESGSAQPALK